MPNYSIGFTASDVCPQTDSELLGDKGCLTPVIFQSASLRGLGCRHLLLHCLVSSVTSRPSLTSIGSAIAENTCQCPPSLSCHSISLLNPKVSGFSHSPHRDLRVQGFPSQLLTTPDRWSLGTGYPRAQNEGSFETESRRPTELWERSAI